MTPQMHGRYPDHDVLAQSDRWDEPTRSVVMGRLHAPAYRYFQQEQIETLEAFCDAIMAQDEDPRIEVLRYVDHNLSEERGTGHRYADMPDDGETWRIVARGLDEAAAQVAGCRFAGLDAEARDGVIGRFADGGLRDGAWSELSPAHAWSVVTGAIVTAFYAHPWAWNEIGFGGPGYPRGYMRLGPNQREPWEGAEARELVADFQHDVESDPGMAP
ncbi:MAG TPA: gluconate 2-dehydrogenase subunit 3 family protein [Gaiellales bacterium]|nr:gluconate 2-dehydrogenase subunit 3 family protein [Gaiellales bacterium]